MATTSNVPTNSAEWLLFCAAAVLLLPAVALAQQLDALSLKQPRAIKQVFQDSSGTIWGHPHTGPALLAKWTGTAWQDAPIQHMPHPSWTARPAAPWNSWSYPSQWLMPGRNNTFLAVVVRDVYQKALAESKGEEKDKLNKDHWHISKTGADLVKKLGKDHWLEGWLLRDGKWHGPTAVEKLLQQELATFTKNFADAPKAHGKFNLQSDGERVWVAYQSKVFVHEAGSVAEWPIPQVKKYWSPDIGLCVLPDKRVVCTWVWANEKGYHFKVLRRVKDKIVAEDFPAPALPEYLYSTDKLSLYVGKDKSLWLWIDRPGAGVDLVWRFQQNQWEFRADLGPLLFEEANGALWFMPGKGHEFANEDRGYRIVSSDGTRTYPWPKQYSFGTLTPAPGGKVHAACDDWLITLGPAAEPHLRPLQAQKMEKHVGPGPAFADSAGNFLLPYGFVAAAAKK